MKLFQAVCKDRLFPYIYVFSKGYGKDEEPRRAYGLGYAIAMLMILIGKSTLEPELENLQNQQRETLNSQAIRKKRNGNTIIIVFCR